MAREDDQRLKDMMRAIELGEIEEDILEGDQEDYEDMGGIKSIRKAPSIKMASETPEEEFNLEIMMMLQEFEDAKKNGYGGSLEDFSKEYFTRKQMMKDRQMAMYGGRMQLAEGPKEYGLNEDVIPKTYPDPVTARLETEKEEVAKIREQKSIDDKKGKPKPFTMDEKKIKELIEKRKKELEKKAKGGIAGVL